MACAFNGFAFPVEFDLAGVTVPNEIIYSISFNTSTFGTPPSVARSLRLAECGSISGAPAMGTGRRPQRGVRRIIPLPPGAGVFRAQRPGAWLGARFHTCRSVHHRRDSGPNGAATRLPGADLVGLVDPVTGVWSLRGAAGGVTTFYLRKSG